MLLPFAKKNRLKRKIEPQFFTHFCEPMAIYHINIKMDPAASLSKYAAEMAFMVHGLFIVYNYSQNYDLRNSFVHVKNRPAFSSMVTGMVVF